MNSQVHTPCCIKIKITNTVEAIYKQLLDIHPTFSPPTKITAVNLISHEHFLYASKNSKGHVLTSSLPESNRIFILLQSSTLVLKQQFHYIKLRMTTPYMKPQVAS